MAEVEVEQKIIEQNKKLIEIMEKKIDEMVYELYGLTEEEIVIVEGN